MIKLIEEVLGAFGEIIAWLLGIKKKQSTQNKNVARKPAQPVRKVEPAAQSKNVARESEYDVW